jgi:hypothetical protein
MYGGDPPVLVPVPDRPGHTMRPVLRSAVCGLRTHCGFVRHDADSFSRRIEAHFGDASQDLLSSAWDLRTGGDDDDDDDECVYLIELFFIVLFIH